MPKVKQAAFLCPTCGSPTSVLRTRSALPTRLIRYRRCVADPSHRVTTREITNAEATVVPVRLALQNLAQDFGIDVESSLPNGVRPDNDVQGDHAHADRHNDRR